MELIKPFEYYKNFTDVEKNKLLDEASKRYNKIRIAPEIFDVRKKDEVMDIVRTMIRDSTALSLYGELLFQEGKRGEDVKSEWHDYLVLSGRNYQKIIEILEINGIEKEIFSLEAKYQLILMSLFEFHNARRHAIATSLSRQASETLDRIIETQGDKNIDSKTLYLHKCIIQFLRADFNSCKESAEKIIDKEVNEINNNSEQEILELYDTLSILYILKSIVSIIEYIQSGKNENFEKCSYNIAQALKYSEASRRIDLKYFSNKLQISYKIISDLSLWNIRKLFHLKKDESKKALDEYIQLKMDIKNYFMFTSQFEALFVDKILNNKKNSLISMPTGAGKTFLAELLILNRLLNIRYEAEDEDSVIVYLVPSRALAKEKFEDFTYSFNGNDKLKFKTCQITGEIVLNADEAIEKNDIIIMTQEKFDMILREDFFGVNIHTMIVDEFHNIRSGYRGLKLQFAILRFRDRPEFKKSNIILISAIVKKSNFYEIGDWIYAENLFQTEWRPTFTRIGLLSLDDSQRMIRFNDGISMKSEIPSTIRSTSASQAAIWLTLKFAMKEPVLLFSTYVNYRNKNRLLEIAEEISKEDFEITYLDKNENKIYSDKLRRIVGEERIYQYFTRGIGVHWGMLPHSIRKIMENGLKKKAIGIIISTSTLAEGVNLPIKTLIIPRLKIQDNLIDFGLFFNLIGRAGRPFKQAEGQIILMSNEKGRHKNPKKDAELFYDITPEKIEDIKTPVHLIFKIREEIIPKLKQNYHEKPNSENKRRLDEKIKELKVHEANFESVLLALIVEKLIDRISNNDELIKKITISKSDQLEVGKISNLLNEIETKFIKEYKIVKFVDEGERLKALDFGIVIYRTGFSPQTCIYLYTELKKIALNIKKLRFHPDILKEYKGNQNRFKQIISLMQNVDEGHSYFKQGLPLNYENILLNWMVSTKISWLSEEYFSRESSPVTHTMMIMEGMLSGFSSWFLYAEYLILEYIYKEMNIKEPPCLKSLKQLPKYMWYGTTKVKALNIMRLDISRELLRDDLILIVDKFGDRYIEYIINNPEKVKSKDFRDKLLSLKELRMEDDEFIKVLFKVLTPE